MAQLIKKMKQGMSYSRKEKTIILNVLKYFQLEYPDKCVTELVRRTSRATGCSEKSVFIFRKEEASAEGFKEPSRTKIRKNLNINSRDIKYDSAVREKIRSIIYELKYKEIVPSLNTILKHVSDDPQLPNFSLMTLRRLLSDMGFYYEKNGNKSVLAEKSLNKDIELLQGTIKDKKDDYNTDTLTLHQSNIQNSAYVKSDMKHSKELESLKNLNKGDTEPNININGPNHYNQNHLFIPMQFTHNENNPIGFGSFHHNHHNISVMMNSRVAPPHLYQPSWIHSQNQHPLMIPSN